MAKIDKRVRYFLIFDTETANTHTDENGNLDMSDTLVYDFGCAVIDKRGKVYETLSFVNRDIFVYERDLMKSCYYAKKIPKYIEDIRNGSRIMADWKTIKFKVRELMAKYGIDTVMAHNSYFDYNATAKTERYITKSAFRYFFPYGTTFYDTLKMARDTICKQATYIKFCYDNGYITKNGLPSATAENLYRFISQNLDFDESHTGLEDVMIEKEIFVKCVRQHKKMRKELFNKKE